MNDDIALLSDVQGRPELGALMLDRFAPEWFNTVNILDLDILNPRLCILGQVFPVSAHWRTGYTEVLKWVAHKRGFDTYETICRLKRYGFTSSDKISGEIITAHWIELIMIRRRQLARELKSASVG